MDDGAFDKNFTWYEWGFVSPSEVPSEDLTVPPAPSWYAPGFDPAFGSWPTVYTSSEDHRWQT